MQLNKFEQLLECLTLSSTKYVDDLTIYFSDSDNGVGFSLTGLKKPGILFLDFFADFHKRDKIEFDAPASICVNFITKYAGATHKLIDPNIIDFSDKIIDDYTQKLIQAIFHSAFPEYIEKATIFSEKDRLEQNVNSMNPIQEEDKKVKLKL